MKKIILLAGVAALAACSPAAEAPTEEAVTEAPAEESMAGTYDVSNDEGPQGSTMMNDDGTFVNYDNDGNEMGRGTMAIVDGKTCFTSDEEGAEAECWTDGEPAEDGSWVATSDSGETVTVKKRAEEAMEAATEEAAS